MSDSRDLEQTRPVDCTEDVGIPDDAVPTLSGIALKHYGKPYSELTRRQQRLIKTVVNGERKEIQAEIKALRENTLLTVEQRIEKGHTRRARFDKMLDTYYDDLEDFVTNGDNLEAKEAEKTKTRSGTIFYTAKLFKNLAALEKTQVEIDATLAKMQAEAGPKVVTVNNDNRQVTLTQEDVAAQLQAAIKGELVDQSGDGDGSDTSTDD